MIREILKMKNSIKTLVVGLVGALAFTAMADGNSYLYWMAETPESLSGQLTYAKVAVYNGDTFTEYMGVALASGAIDTEAAGKFVPSVGTDFLNMIAAIGSTALSDSYKFQLELYGGDDNILMLSNMLGFSDANIRETGAGMIGTASAFTGFQIPEPTGGLLMMLGFGLLALRRKQK